jgi:hypothetical protein
MRFMTFVKTTEASGPPPAEFMGAITGLGEEAKAAGVLIDTGGLAPSEAGTLVLVSGGAVSVVAGSPSSDEIGGWAIYEVDSAEEAVKWSSRFMELHLTFWPGWSGETQIRQIFGPPPA